MATLPEVALVTLGQVAHERGLSVRTLQAAARRGALRTVRFGDVYGTTWDAVDAWLAAHASQPGPQPGSGTARLSKGTRGTADRPQPPAPR